MALTPDQYKALIILQVGDNAAGLLAAQIDLLWESHDTIADDGLRALYTKIGAIDLMLGEARKYASFKALDGSSVSASDLFKHLMEMREAVEAQIAQAAAGLGGGGALGELTTTAPIMPDDGRQSDPNARRYRGDPLRPPWERRLP